jgi:hypothetical protein
MKNLSKVRGMGRLAKLGLVVGGLGVAGVIAAGPSFAATPPQGTTVSITGQSATGGAHNSGTAVAHYTAVYNDPFFGSVRCTGINQTGKNFGNGQDTFTCTSTTGALSSVSPNQQITWGSGMWVSDYNGAPATHFSATVSADGTSYTAVATY